MTTPTLFPRHYDELKLSGISDALIERYFYSIEGEAAQEWLIEDAFDNVGGHGQQYATGPVRRLLEQSEHVKAGGWICSANGQIKPDQPRQQIKLHEPSGEWLTDFDESGNPKLIKYESKREKPYQGVHVSLMQPVGTPKTHDGQRLIIITEGGKKAAAAATLGYESIGLPGVDMGSLSGSDELIPVLADLAGAGAAFAIAFDQDSKKSTKKGVVKSLARLAAALMKAGVPAADISVPTWKSKDGKGLDDLLVVKGADAVHKAISEAKLFKDWKAAQPKSYFKSVFKRSAGYERELDRIKAMHETFNAEPVADVTLNQRYLDKGALFEEGTVSILASPMSTGKTSQHLAGIVEEHRTKYPDSVRVSSAYRNILLRQSGAALGFTHWLDTDGDPSLAKFGALAACPESLPKLAGQKIPSNSLLIVDEVVAWLRHIFTSDTMKNGADRIAVLNAVKTIFSKIVDGGGFVVLMEAGIPQWAIDCLRDLLPAGTPLKLTRNEFKLQANQPAYFYDKPTAFKSELETIVMKGARVCAASDSATQVDSQWRMMFDAPTDFHISSKNSSEPEAQEFAADPKAELARRAMEKVLLRFFSYTPTIGAGVSIDDDPNHAPWFDAKAGYFTHLTSSDAAQQLARYRRFVPLHIYCQTSGRGISLDDLSIFDPAALQANWKDSAKYCHQLTDTLTYLTQGGEESFHRVLIRSLEGQIPEIEQLDKWRSIITAVDNFDKADLKANLQKRLKADGYQIIELKTENTPGEAERFKALREQSEAEAGEEFAALSVPDEMTPDEAHTVLSTHGHSRKETLQARKCLYQFEFPKADFNSAEFCSEWLVKGKGKKMNQLRAEWAARNPDAAKAIDRWHLKNKLKQAYNLGTGVSIADVAQFSPEADIFSKSGLPAAIDAIGADIYSNDHPEVMKVAKWVNGHQPLLKKIMRMKFNEERSNLDIFNSMARKLGYAPRVEKSAGKDSQREKQYILTDFCNPDRGHMLKSLSDKFSSKLEKKGEELNGKRLSPSPEWGATEEQLSARQDNEPQPIAPVTLYTSFDNSADDLAFYFEQDLCTATTFAQLLEAKQRTPKAVQSRVMAVWEKDGRYEALGRKAIALKGAA